MTSFAVTLCECCWLHIAGQQVVSDISVVPACWNKQVSTDVLSEPAAGVIRRPQVTVEDGTWVTTHWGSSPDGASWSQASLWSVRSLLRWQASTHCRTDKGTSSLWCPMLSGATSSESEWNELLGRVTVDELARQINLLPMISSPSDCLPVSLLKASVDVMAPLLAQLANLSFAAGVFPLRYKLGHVMPLLKAGLSTNDTVNYTPITNFCTISKILERLVMVHLRHTYCVIW